MRYNLLTQSRARVFTGSLESAIYLLSTICAIPPTVSTLPVINTNFTHHISAGLADGTQITGQNSISHPSAPTSLPDDNDDPSSSSSSLGNGGGGSSDETEEHDRIEDATLPGSLPTLRKPYINFSKTTTTTAATTSPSSSSTTNTGTAEAYHDDDLPARISRIWYINPYGHEIFPPASAKVLSAVRAARAVVYSVGSLYTSIVPSLVPRGVGAALSAADGSGGGGGGPRFKVLILNSANDRETGPRAAPLTATDFVRAVARAAAGSGGSGSSGNSSSNSRGDREIVVTDDDERSTRSAEDEAVRRYVTHLVYLEGEGAPRVDRDELAALGVDCIRVYGRRVDGMLRYDEAGLARALEAVIGKPEMLRSRRNTSGQ